MTGCSDAMAVPTILKCFECLVQPWNIHVVEGKQMEFIEWIKQVMLLEKIKQAIVQEYYTPVYINP